jgi:DNA-binding transcriptional regulator YiaG
MAFPSSTTIDASMTPTEIQSIRKRAGLSQSGLAALLRISDLRTVRRWETGDTPISGPASIILELLDAGELPERFL